MYMATMMACPRWLQAHANTVQDKINPLPISVGALTPSFGDSVVPFVLFLCGMYVRLFEYANIPYEHGRYFSF